MSIEISMMLTDNNDLSGEYCVKRMHGCTAIFGSIPMQELSGLLKVTKGQFCCMKLAKELGAVLVYGLKESLDQLLKDVKEGRVAVSNPNVDNKVKPKRRPKTSKREM